MKAQDFILKYIPQGDKVEVNGNNYTYVVIDSKVGSFRLKKNSDSYETTYFSAFPDELKAECEEVAVKLASEHQDDRKSERLLKIIRAWYEREPKPERNHEAVAELFTWYYKDVVCYSKELKEWFFYNGKHWEIDESERIYNDLIFFNKCVIAVISGSFVNRFDQSSERQKQNALKWAVGLNNNRALEDVLHIAAKKCGVSLKEFDKNDWLLNVKNGTIDLKTGYKHNHDPKDRITVMVDANYYKDAKYDRWDSTLLESCGGRRAYVRYLQKEFGYGITGLTEEELLMMLLGLERTGKSTFYEPVMELLGEYAHYMAFNTLKSSDREGGAPREDLLRLRTCRLVMCSEVNPKTKFDTALTKKIISGEKIVARGIHGKHSVEFTPKFKVVIGTNYSPIIPYDDGGSYRRIKVNPFYNQVALEKVDKAIKREFKTVDAARERILAWLVEGCLLWQQDGLDAEPREVTRANSKYRLEQNPLNLYILDNCIADRFGRVTVETLVEDFNYKRADYGEEEISAKSLGRFMKPLEVEFKKGRDKKQRYYEGIRLRNQEEIDAELDFYEIETFNEALVRECSLVNCNEWIVNLVTFDVYNVCFPYFLQLSNDTCIINAEPCFQTSNVTIEQNKPSQLDQVILRDIIIQILNKLKKGMTSPKDITTDAASEAVAFGVRELDSEFEEYPVEQFYKKLLENDKDVQAIVADCARGRT
jgi:P4 family phage/plasmid primase-like protien